jgi:hypothetical protein
MLELNLHIVIFGDRPIISNYGEVDSHSSIPQYFIVDKMEPLVVVFQCADGDSDQSYVALLEFLLFLSKCDDFGGANGREVARMGK